MPKKIEIVVACTLIIVLGNSHVKEEWQHLFNNVPKEFTFNRDKEYGYSTVAAMNSEQINEEIPTYVISSVSVDSARFLLQTIKTVSVTTFANVYSNKWFFLDTVNNTNSQASLVQVVCQDLPCPFLNESGYNCQYKQASKVGMVNYFYYQCKINPKYDFTYSIPSV